DRNEGYHQSARRGRGTPIGGSTDRNALCHRSPRGAHAIGTRGATERNGGVTSRNWPCHGSEILPPLLETRQAAAEKRLCPRGGTLISRRWHPSLQHVDPLLQTGGSPSFRPVDPLPCSRRTVAPYRSWHNFVSRTRVPTRASRRLEWHECFARFFTP